MTHSMLRAGWVIFIFQIMASAKGVFFWKNENPLEKTIWQLHHGVSPVIHRI